MTCCVEMIIFASFKITMSVSHSFLYYSFIYKYLSIDIYVYYFVLCLKLNFKNNLK